MFLALFQRLELVLQLVVLRGVSADELVTDAGVTRLPALLALLVVAHVSDHSLIQLACLVLIIDILQLLELVFLCWLTVGSHLLHYVDCMLES